MAGNRTGCNVIGSNYISFGIEHLYSVYSCKVLVSPIWKNDKRQLFSFGQLRNAEIFPFFIITLSTDNIIQLINQIIQLSVVIFLEIWLLQLSFEFLLIFYLVCWRIYYVLGFFGFWYIIKEWIFHKLFQAFLNCNLSPSLCWLLSICVFRSLFHFEFSFLNLSVSFFKIFKYLFKLLVFLYVLFFGTYYIVLVFHFRLNWGLIFLVLPSFHSNAFTYISKNILVLIYWIFQIFLFRGAKSLQTVFLILKCFHLWIIFV